MHIYFSQRMAAPSHSPVITAHLITESLDWPIWGLGPCLACPCFCGQSEVGWLLTDTGWLFPMTQEASVLQMTSWHAVRWFNLVGSLGGYSHSKRASPSTHTPLKPLPILCSLMLHWPKKNLQPSPLCRCHLLLGPSEKLHYKEMN